MPAVEDEGGGLQGLFIHAFQTEADAISQPFSVSFCSNVIIGIFEKTDSLCCEVNQRFRLKGQDFSSGCVWIDERQRGLLPPPPEASSTEASSISVAPTLYCRAKWGQPGLAAQTTVCRKEPRKKKKEKTF